MEHVFENCDVEIEFFRACVRFVVRQNYEKKLGKTTFCTSKDVLGTSLYINSNNDESMFDRPISSAYSEGKQDWTRIPGWKTAWELRV